MCIRKGGFKYIWRSKKVGASGFYSYVDDPFEENNMMFAESSQEVGEKISEFRRLLEKQRVVNWAKKH